MDNCSRFKGQRFNSFNLVLYMVHIKLFVKWFVKLKDVAIAKKQM